MIIGVPDPWLSTLREGLKADVEAMDGWLAWRRERMGQSEVKTEMLKCWVGEGHTREQYSFTDLMSLQDRSRHNS